MRAPLAVDGDRMRNAGPCLSTRLAATALCLAAAWPYPAGAQSGRPPALVEVDAVREEPIARTVPVVGRVVPREHGTVAAAIGGPVAEVRVRVGERVEAGDVLIVLARDLPEARLHQRRADESLEEARVRTAEAEVDLVRQELERLEKLKDSAAFPKAAWEDKRQELVRRRSRVREAAAALARARVQREMAEIELARATVRAPYAGVVTSRRVAPGSYVKAGTRWRPSWTTGIRRSKPTYPPTAWSASPRDSRSASAWTTAASTRPRCGRSCRTRTRSPAPGRSASRPGSPPRTTRAGRPPTNRWWCGSRSRAPVRWPPSTRTRSSAATGTPSSTWSKGRHGRRRRWPGRSGWERRWAVGSWCSTGSARENSCRPGKRADQPGPGDTVPAGAGAGDATRRSGPGRPPRQIRERAAPRDRRRNRSRVRVRVRIARGGRFVSGRP